MKFRVPLKRGAEIEPSCPARGTWIEIMMRQKQKSSAKSRAPQGARGLKFRKGVDIPRGLWSCPARGTWIEIAVAVQYARINKSSCPARGTWIEIFSIITSSSPLWSCPARGTWIEIPTGHTMKEATA